MVFGYTMSAYAIRWEVATLESLFVDIGIGTVAGTLSRAYLLKQDYRQYPSYPNGYLIQFTLGFVAAALGAVAVPALITKNFVAVTFLALAVQQFRDIRKMEGDSLRELEKTEYTPRGAAYIDGIAKTFEARNYIAMLVALVATGTVTLLDTGTRWLDLGAALLLALLFFRGLSYFSRGKTVGDIAKVELAPIGFEGDTLYIGDILVTNIGLAEQRHLLSRNGLGVIITPNEPHLEIGLANMGQRQAMAAEAARALGVRRYIRTRRDFDKGRIGLLIVPINNDPGALVEAIKSVPLLESVKKSHAVMKPVGKGKEAG